MSNELNINHFINTETINKQLLQLKPPNRNGLLLQLHDTNERSKSQQKLSVRFLHLSFDKSENILVAANHLGNIVLVDLNRSKFWVLPQISTCTVLRFSPLNPGEILLGLQSGDIYILNIDTADITGDLKCHCYPVLDLTFFHHTCLSFSKREAIVWDLRTNSKVQILTLANNCLLNHMMFTPVVGNIVACFDDNTVVIWECNTFEVSKQIHLPDWNNSTIKSVTFTRNGRAVVFAGHLPYLVTFAIDSWTVLNKIILPDFITSLKKVLFIPQMFDGGSNKILGLLTGNGILYFYDMEKNAVFNNLTADTEIIKFDSSADGQYISCLLKTGEINIYSSTRCMQVHREQITPVQKKIKNKNSPMVNLNRTNQLARIQKQINDCLDIDKLHSILKEFGEYPDAYRAKIWARLLKVPNNKEHYNNCINLSSKPLCANLKLDNKSSLLSLKKLLSNLIIWCPYFEHVNYLPVLVFPFTKIFQNDPICCFESVCTIILNWCQHWFEYFPLPPINILAIIENILLEHDQELLTHFTYCNITSTIYAWPLLEAAFSEVLNANQWCVLWDHILSNEPSFLIMAVVAYNILNRKSLTLLKTKDDFLYFYHNQNIINIKQFISKCYALLNGTSDRNHPSQYLDLFKSMESGPYGSFTGFPKNLVHFNFGEYEKLKEEQVEIEMEEQSMLNQRQVLLKNMEIAEHHKVEEERLNEVEKACRQKILEETEKVKKQRNRINKLRNQLQLEEIDLLNKSRERLLFRRSREKQHVLEELMNNVQKSRINEDKDVLRAEGDLINRYSELLRHKIKLEESLQTEQPSPGLSNEYQLLKSQQKKLLESLNEIKKCVTDRNQMKSIAIATDISAMDNLILKIETELAQQMTDKCENFNKRHSNAKLLMLESETKQLEMEVSKLLTVLADVKSEETKRLGHGNGTQKIPRNFDDLQKSIERRTISNTHSGEGEFAKLRKMIQTQVQSDECSDASVVYEKELKFINLETV